MKFIGLFIVLCCFLGLANAQTLTPQRPKLGKNDTIRVGMTIVDGEYIPWLPLQDVLIYDTRIFKDAKARADYNMLRYNVLKVAPYAMFAGNRYRQLERDLATTNDKQKQKEMVKTCEKEVKDLFNHEIKNMTITQGEILIKLVNRETGDTSYELVKELKGGINAFMFQSLARLFGHNLKETYDPQEEHDIETILNNAGYKYHRN
ncbi:hypothetical protein BEL04_15055 [Mucilaginibacter sp. PPCGB 2223]|uniref:DUF4294 domain-containing protein n=1 Tax=Mucilaginibacter sp. PPCGB 2223 TaxID=1886027 RepID=UPI0008268D1A|nr:DUF4294 domain-containing protein [Mucilaginibacter sp. PPCGB 2223]OCX51347.1 hypothetical protein BEL04_15055 [Mucilaginibacter sp. PPCGB 2223]